MEQETSATDEAEAVAEGDLVLISYVGRVSSTDEIFDLTDEDKAQSEGIYEEEADYGPIPVLVGRGYVVEGLENDLVGRTIGDKAEISVPADKAFGQRSSDQIRTISENQFRESDVRAFPGSVIRVGGRQGKVIAKSSGRVKVDFNHPLAGKELSYETEIKQKIKQPEEKVRKIIEYYLDNCLSVDIIDGNVKASLDPEPDEIPEELLSNIKEDIEYACDNIESVELVGESEEASEEEK